MSRKHNSPVVIKSTNLLNGTFVVCLCKNITVFLRATECIASRILAIVEASVRTSVCRSVWHTLDLYQNNAS